MRVTATETVDATPKTQIDLVKFFVSEAAGEQTISLAGATAVEKDGVTFTVFLTEAQRAAAVISSSTPGGDSSAVVLDVNAEGFDDIGTNAFEGVTGLQVTEDPDIVRPRLLLSHIDFNDGTLVIEASETLDMTPAVDEVDLLQFHIANVSGTTNQRVTLDGADAVQVDAVNITVILTEAQRVRAVQISGTQGGDGQAAQLDLDADALNDLSSNTNLQSPGVLLIETADTTIPEVQNATLDLNDGTLIFEASETIDADPIANVDPSKLSLSNIAGDDQITLEGATVSPSELPRATITLTEQQRVDAIANSGTSGGDGTGMVFDAKAAAMQDVAINNNVDNIGLNLIEIADTTPQILCAQR